MTKVFSIIILLLSQIYLFATPTNRSVFKLYNWALSAKYLYYNMGVDSTITSYPLLLEPEPARKGMASFTVPFYQTKNIQTKVEVRVRYKSENCPLLYLRLATIGSDEQIIATDTLFLPLSKEWATSSLLMNECNGSLLSLSIEAIGNSRDKVITSFNPIKFENNAKIWIDQLEVFINGENLTDILSIHSNKQIINPLTKEDFIPITNESRHHLPFLDKKILAIGETVHGTSTMNNAAIEIIKDRVENRNCKFVLLEIPLEYSFYINRYVASDQRFKLDSISTYFDNLLYSKELISFIHWLKDYNSSRKEKVSLVGIDKDYDRLLARTNLFNFFYTINQGVHNKELNKLCIALLSLNEKLPYQTSLSIFDENQGFKNILNEKESNLIRNCLAQKDNISLSYFQRDSIMYENTKTIIDNLLKEDETITMFCHFGHTNYLSQREWMDAEDWNLGHYLKHKYNNDYCNIALVTETGNCITSNEHSKMVVEKLSASPSNSLEYFINAQKIDSCYLSMDKFSDSDAIRIRLLGNSNRLRNRFIYIIPQVRMDGVIFIKHSSAIHKEKELFNKTFNKGIMIMKAYGQALKKSKAITM